MNYLALAAGSSSVSCWACKPVEPMGRQGHASRAAWLRAGEAGSAGIGHCIRGQVFPAKGGVDGLGFSATSCQICCPVKQHCLPRMLVFTGCCQDDLLESPKLVRAVFREFLHICHNQTEQNVILYTVRQDNFLFFVWETTMGT